MPSASACAYLVIAGLVAAGMDGLKRQLPLPPARQTEADGATRLPVSLEESLVALDADSMLKAALGEELVRWFIGVKRGELDAVEQRVNAKGGNERVRATCTLEAWRHVYMEYL